MTNKEFEAKKQEIIDDIDNAASKGLKPNGVRKWEITEVALGEIETKIKQLQPPKPPTCSICAYRNAVTDDLTLGMKYTYVACTNPVMLHNLGIKFLRVDQLTIEPAKEFGCVFHSDYEVAE